MSTKALDDLQASSIDSILQEQRSFPPPPEFSQHAHIKSLEEYERVYKESMDDPDKFWSRIASELHDIVERRHLGWRADRVGISQSELAPIVGAPLIALGSKN